jgi:hypothetical protein
MEPVLKSLENLTGPTIRATTGFVPLAPDLSQIGDSEVYWVKLQKFCKKQRVMLDLSHSV